jgi:hypothetical protein
VTALPMFADRVGTATAIFLPPTPNPNSNSQLPTPNSQL